MMTVRRPLWLVIAAAAASACTGAINQGGGSSPPDNGGGPSTPGGSNNGGSSNGGSSNGSGGGGSTNNGGGSNPGSGGGTMPGPVATIGPSRMRMLTRAQLVNSLTDLLGAVQLGDTQPDDRVGTDDNFFTGVSYDSLSAGGATLYHDSLKAALTALFGNPAQRTSLLATCTPVSATDMGCFSKFVTAFGQRAWRRQLTSAEVSRYAGVASTAATMLSDPIKGLMYATMGLLESPNFLYRIEVGAPSSDLGGRFKYTSVEMASRLSYWLWNTTPDPMLLQWGIGGQLDTPAGVQMAVSYLLKSDRAKAGIGDYAFQLFKLDEVISRSKDMEPRYTATVRQAMATEVQMMFQNALTTPGDALDLLTTDKGYANAELAALYGITGVTGNAMVPVTYPANQHRAGFLGTGAFLAEQAKATDTSPTQRGLFVVRHVLCQTIPPPPANVNQNIASPDPKTGLTKRQILDQHRHDPTCAGCHGAFDPVGYAFESFDWVGTFRTTDASLKPVDTSGDITGLGKWTNLGDLSGVLKALPDTKTCLMSNLYTFIQGREPKDGDAFDSGVLTSWAKAFDNDGHQLGKFFADLATSDGFRYASPAPVDNSSAGH